MIAGTHLPPLPDAIATMLRGEPMEWRYDGPIDRAVDACVAHDVVGLVYHRLQTGGADVRCPNEFCARIAERARADAAIELGRRVELASALTALADARPLLLKGAALAYDTYPFPAARPRADADVLVPRDRVDAARAALLAVGYIQTLFSDGELIFRQFEMQKIDAFGICHAIDVHWAISTQTIFADLFSYDELAADATSIPALGPHARAAGSVHALLLACVHPVMHHRNDERWIWTSDVNLIARRLTREQWRGVVGLAKSKGIAAIVVRGLASARTQWGTDVPPDALAELGAVTGEATASYLEPGRRWHHEMVANVAHLSTWRGRLTLLREVAFPSPAYMTRAYGVHGAAAAVLLPALYLHRLTLGATRILRGQK